MTLKNLLAPHPLLPEQRNAIEARLRLEVAQPSPRRRWTFLGGRSGAIAIATVLGLGGVGVATAAQLGGIPLPWVQTPGVKPAPAPPPPHDQACPLSSLHAYRLDAYSSGSDVISGDTSGDLITVRNIGRTTCYLGGYLPVYAGGRLLPQESGDFGFLAANIPPGQAAQFGIMTAYVETQHAGAGTDCPPAPSAVSVRLGDEVIDHLVVYDDICNRTTITPVGVDPGSPPIPTTPIAHLTIALNFPREIRIGRTMRFTVTLTNPTASPVDLSPCPSYGMTMMFGGEQNYVLNCSAPTIPAGGSESFDMQYNVPARAYPGPTKFSWFLLGAASLERNTMITLVR